MREGRLEREPDPPTPPCSARRGGKACSPPALERRAKKAVQGMVTFWKLM